MLIDDNKDMNLQNKYDGGDDMIRTSGLLMLNGDDKQ